MAGRGRVVATMLLLLVSCSPKPPAQPSAAADDMVVQDTSAESAGPSLAPLDPASADFCQMRQSGPAQLIAFLNAVEVCDGLGSAAERAQARCANLGANETRLRSRYSGDGPVMAALNRARSRPWPACAIATAVVPSEGPAGDEVEDQSPAPELGEDEEGRAS